MLLAALVLSSGLAGCFDKGDEQTTSSDTGFLERWRAQHGDKPIPPEEYERYYRPPPSTCEGCIPLDVPPEVPPAPPAHHDERVFIPYPKVDDRAVVEGRLWDLFMPEPGIIRPHDQGDYALSFWWGSSDDGLAVLNTEFEPFLHEYGPYDTEVQWATWNVSLESRRVQDGQRHGFVPLDGPLRSDWRESSTHIEPRLETLFWLGAHVWGRELALGDSFTTRWLLPGTSEEALRFEYRVLQVDRDLVQIGHGSPHGWVSAGSDVRIQLRVTDLYDNVMDWTLFFDEESPYPTHLSTATRRSNELPSFMPPAMTDQRIHLVHRGHAPFEWADDVIRPAPQQTADDAGFRLSERVASAALDTLPLYPLRTALADLSLLYDGYDAMWQRPDPPVLVEANHLMRTTTAPDVLRHEWHLIFAQAGGIVGFSVFRLSSHGVLSPVADTGSRPIAGPFAVPLASFLHDHPDVDPLLGSGAPGVAHLAALGITRADTLHYALRVDGTERIGGTLAAYRHDVEDVAWDSDVPLGHFIQDLGTRRLIERGVLTP